MDWFDNPTQLSISPLEDDVDYRDFQIAGNELPKQKANPGAELHICSQGPVKAYMPPLPCDTDVQDILNELPGREYDMTFSEEGDQVRITREVDQNFPLTLTKIAEMILTGIQRVALNPQRFIQRWPRKVLHSFFLTKHPLAKEEWYIALRSSVFSKIDNCRRNACSGVALIGVTPMVKNRYTNFEMPALMTDLYFAHKDKTTPFFRAGQEMIPLDFAEFRRLSRHDLDVALNEAERARKGIAIVSCCNDYWDEVRETTRGKAEWLAKEVTDYRG